MPASSASWTIGRSNDDLADFTPSSNLHSEICILHLRESLMQIARVVGTVVSTQKHRKFEGAKLLLVQPLNLDETPRGTALLAVDGVGAGVREKVLIVLEGRAAGEALNRKAVPVDAAIIGIVDAVDVVW
jgi:ethanolamine utilization protein EutN